MDYTISRAPREEWTKVVAFVTDNFLPTMPLFVAFGVQHCFPPNLYLSQQPGPEDFTLWAVNGQGETVAVAVNTVKPTMNLQSDASEQVKKTVELMNYAEQEAGLNKLPERTIELQILSVRQDWRKRGLARRLAEESIRVARESGFKAMTVCCASEFTARLARKLGCRELYRLAYREYTTLTGREVNMKITPPHEHLYYYVTEL